MKRILVLGAGGTVGKWITRCLSKSPDLTVFGRDDGEFNRHMVEVPWGHTSYDHQSSVFYDDYDLIYPAAAPLVTRYAGTRNALAPLPEVVAKCDDKALCASLLGDLAPKTYWVRDTHGAGGSGAQMASEYLPGENYAVEMVWHKGELDSYFMKERISYSAKERSEIVTGTAAVARCIDQGYLLDLAIDALRRITPDPHGIFTVDFKCSETGIPKVTEVNAGKFATSSYPFYHDYWNLPLRAVELALDMELTPFKEYPTGMTVIRGYDSWPFIGRV